MPLSGIAFHFAVPDLVDHVSFINFRPVGHFADSHATVSDEPPMPVSCPDNTQ